MSIIDNNIEYLENVILAKQKIKTYDRYYQLALKTSEC